MSRMVWSSRRALAFVNAVAVGMLLMPALAIGEGIPLGGPPHNMQLPSISGTPAAGETLFCSQGVWEGNPASYTYAWLRDGSSIAGQTASTYTVQIADQGHAISCAVTATNSTGEYTIIGLPTATYKVTFKTNPQAGNYLTQYFNGVSSSGAATTVLVKAGSVTGGVDAAMPLGGQIVGRVTDAADPAAAAEVQACAELEGRQEACSATNSSGEYTISGLPSGSYVVWFHTITRTGRPWNWSKYYNDKPSSAEADIVSVLSGSVTPGINEEMQTGQIEGRVTAAIDGSPLEGDEVCARYAGEHQVSGSCARTNASGEYSLSSLMAGPYTVRFSAMPTGNYRTQYYNNEPSSETASVVNVTTGNTTDGINASLEAGGRIIGKVTSASAHAPLQGITVCSESAIGSGPCTTTNVSGEYALQGLTTESYRVSFFTEWEGANYLPQYYNGKSEEGEENTIAVTAGSTTEGIDAEMHAGGEITGKVTSAASHLAVPHIVVCARSRCDATNAAGEYTIDGLPAGSTPVTFRRFLEGGNFLSQLYSGQTLFSSANTVPVAAGNITAGIDAELLVGGEITGRVTTPDGSGIAGVTVCAQYVGPFSEAFINQLAGGESECAVSSSEGGVTTATSTAAQIPAQHTAARIPARHITLIKTSFNSTTDELDLYLEFVEPGTLDWSLFFDNSDVAFADAVNRRPGTRAERRCRSGYVRHKGKCVAQLVPFARGSRTVRAGIVEIKVHADAKAVKALNAGRELHVSGRLSFHSALGGPVIARTVKAVAHGHKRHLKAHIKSITKHKR